MHHTNYLGSLKARSSNHFNRSWHSEAITYNTRIFYLIAILLDTSLIFRIWWMILLSLSLFSSYLHNLNIQHFIVEICFPMFPFKLKSIPGIIVYKESLKAFLLWIMTRIYFSCRNFLNISNVGSRFI